MKPENKVANTLSSEILNAYKKLLQKVQTIPQDNFFKKLYEMSDIKVSAADIIAYQIGWGELLVYWYQSGVQKIEFTMPGDGFEKWDYHNIALFFHKKHSHFSRTELLDKFNTIVGDIVKIADHEFMSDNLNTPGIWKWCTLKSGKEWPLSKWIRVNTIAPYKKAYTLITSICAHTVDTATPE